VLVAICTEDAPDVRSLRADTPHRLAAAVACALSRDPSARFGSASEFLEALSELGRSTRPASARRTRTLVAAVLATLLGFTLTAVLVARRAASTRSAAPSSATPTAASPEASSTGSTASTSSPLVMPVDPPLSAASAVPATIPESPRATSSPRRKPNSSAPDGGVARSLELSTREP
jgi:hypothetical protein